MVDSGDQIGWDQTMGPVVAWIFVDLRNMRCNQRTLSPDVEDTVGNRDPA